MKAVILKTSNVLMCLTVESISPSGNTANCIFGAGLKVQIKFNGVKWYIYKAVDGYGIDVIKLYQLAEITPLYEKQPSLIGLERMEHDFNYYNNISKQSSGDLRGFLSSMVEQLKYAIEEQSNIELNKIDKSNPDRRYEY